MSDNQKKNQEPENEKKMKSNLDLLRREIDKIFIENGFKKGASFSKAGQTVVRSFRKPLGGTQPTPQEKQPVENKHYATGEELTKTEDTAPKYNEWTENAIQEMMKQTGLSREEAIFKVCWSI